MARRLAVLLTRNLATDTRKVFHRTFAAACYGGTSFGGMTNMR